jgi:hypothetical protein
MPVSSPLCKRKMINWIIEYIPKDAKILDIGPGCGTYSDILTSLSYNHIDAVEIYEPYITKYNLGSKYNEVYNCDINDFNFMPFEYDFVILGDVLEHMTRETGQRLIKSLQERHVKYIIVSVPFANTQGTYDGNVYETHLQNDLNAETFTQYYPGFTLIADEEDRMRQNHLGEWEHITAWVWVKDAI